MRPKRGDEYMYLHHIHLTACIGKKAVKTGVNVFSIVYSVFFEGFEGHRVKA